MPLVNSKKGRYFLYSSLCALLLFGGARLYYRLTDDFRLTNISEDLSYRNEWEIAPPAEEEKLNVQSILQQPFHYIGKGAQSYAFSSEDDKYVLKFFKFKHLRPTPLLDWLPAWSPLEDYRLKQAARKTRKLEGVFSGYHLAYHEHRDESGLIFIHLNKTKKEFPTVQLVDKIGRNHFIALDDVVFLIQHKGETLRTVFHRLLEAGEVEKTKQFITDIFNLYLSEYQKGIYDHDHGVMHNAGFVAGRPIHLDVGKLKKDENMRLHENYSADIVLVAARMCQWLKDNEPKAYPILLEHIQAKLQEITFAPFPSTS